MRGIILAGGTGSRLFPLTKVTNKHLLPVGKKPMIFYPVEKLVDVGITDILVVTGPEHMGDIVGCLGSGKDFGCSFTYKVQDEAGGIAQALSLASSFCSNEPMCVILGDNIFEDRLTDYIKDYQAQNGGARIVLKAVENPERYGVATLDDKGNVLRITEKPVKPETNLAVVGVYFYDSTVFSIIRDLRPSQRNELEITDVHNKYIERKELQASRMGGNWTDAGTPESWFKANIMVHFNLVFSEPVAKT